MKIKYFLFLAIIIFGLNSCTNKKEKIRQELNLGIKASYSGKNDIAKAHFRKVIQWDEDNAEAYLYLGRVSMNQQKYPIAMDYLNKAILLNPKYGEAYRSRAQLFFILGDRDASCQDYLAAEENGVKNLYNYTKHCR